MDLTAILENVERLPYTVTNTAGDVLGEGWVDVDTSIVTQGFLLAVANATVLEGETAEDAARRLAELSMSPIRGWDLTRGDTPIAVNVDEYLALPTLVIAAMGEAMGAVASPKARSAATSAGGSRPGRTN